MLRFSVVFLIIAIAAAVYALRTSGAFPEILAFSSIVVLYLSLLGSQNKAHQRH